MKTAVTIVLVFALGGAACAQNAGNTPSASPVAGAGQGEIKEKYHAARVDLFDVKPGVDFPPEYLKSAQEEIAQELASARVFDEVLQAGQQPSQADVPVIRLTGTIHNYKQGSRAKRYFGVGGMGSSEIDAQVAFLDAATGQRLVIEELRAVLLGGVFGGNEANSTKELARQVITQAKLMLNRKLPPPGENATAPSDSFATADRRTLTINAKDWSETEKKLDEEAASGYRVVAMSLTGSSTADLELEKSATPLDVYQYRWVHVRLATHLQKDVSKAAADGFHASAHTLAILGPYVSVLMEKPPATSALRYQYQVAEPLRISSAQKDTETREREGYTLLDETELGGIHILLFEKTTGAASQ
jgi:hypothetical protein